MILRFETDYRPLSAEDYKGDGDSEVLRQMVEAVAKKINDRFTIDNWNQANLGYVEFFGKDGEDSLQSRLTDNQREWLFVEVCDRSIDTRQKVWDIMADMGAIKASVNFSGGHDEGGVDSITITLGDGSHRHLSEWPKENDEKDALLVKYACEPVYEQWYGFAGEFSVHGTVVWDAATQKVHMSGDETVESYESFEREV